jgi:DNA/RNA-binding domain of Phe-tRNA-synthetase-like protein
MEQRRALCHLGVIWLADMISLCEHPLLDASWFVTRTDRPAASLEVPTSVARAIGDSTASPLQSDDHVRTVVRSLLRHGGYKPSGRGKPASEYLLAAHAEHRFPRINTLVDICNVVSLCSGLPISLLDVDKFETGNAESLRIAVMAEGTNYIFNPSGQTIDASGLLALCDSAGPAGTPVKDAQRTKTNDNTTSTLTVIWGSRALADRTRLTRDWYLSLLADVAGATIEA